MVTYLVLNVVVLAAVLLIFRVALGRIIWNRAVIITAGVLLVTTAIFDSMIVGSGIVDYDKNLILGLRIGAAPLEDFFYAIMAALLVPSVWHVVRKDNHRAGN